MKKIFSIFSCALVLAFATSCDWFELDNQESYNASIHGAFLDVKTGEPVQSEHAVSTTVYTWGSYSWTVDIATGGIMSVTETGWDAESAQTWNVKNNGTYCNNLVFAGKYRFDGKETNFFDTTQEFTINKGDNEVNFPVTPFARIKDLKITNQNGIIKASYSIESGDPSQVKAIYEARFCIYTDRYVGIIHNNAKNNSTDYRSFTVLNSGLEFDKTYEMYIDTNDTDGTNGTDLATEFQYKRPHYLRVAVCAVGDIETSYPYGPWWPVTSYVGVNSSQKRYNYSPVYKLDEDGSISEVTDW